jgi:HSP20 family molecular chaperone IbpA
MPDGVDREKIAVDFVKGVLTITMPKTPRPKSRRGRSR